MVKKYLPFHQFRKIDESIIDEIMVTNGVSVLFEQHYQEMVDSAEDGYYNDDCCEVSFYLPRYKNELVTVFFESTISFNESYTPGDNLQPPDYDIHNENLDIYVQDIIMENYDVEIDLLSDEVKKLEDFIVNVLTC